MSTKKTTAHHPASTSGRDNIAALLSRHAQAIPEKLALCVAGRELGYGELGQLAQSMGRWLHGHGKTGRIGILAGRSVGAYAGVLGACWAGGTYVPLGLSWPPERLRHALELAQLDALILDAAGAKIYTPALQKAGPETVFRTEAAPGDFTPLEMLAAAPDFAPVARPAEHIAYILFTSGTTGVPKGVMVSLGAITHHLAVMQEEYRLVPTDRASLTRELTFDPSVLNLFLTWNAGASLHVMDVQDFNPLRFIETQRLTVWNASPTSIAPLVRQGALTPGLLPGLRLSIFGGDLLALVAAQAWAAATPNGIVENVYGPTEAAIEVTRQRLTDPPVVTPGSDGLAIGLPYEGNEIAILDEAQTVLGPNEVGELAIAGRQLAEGYLGQPELTAERFRVLAGKRWYLTGDKAYIDEAGRAHHVGRLDNQVKIRGYRVELGEIEAHLRQICATDSVAALPWPFEDGVATGIVGFVATEAPAVERKILVELARRLPLYMVPRKIMFLPSLPLTPHAKIDRVALRTLLDESKTA